MDASDLIAVCDVDPEAAERVAKKHGVKAFTNLVEMLKEPGIEAVDVVTSGSHRDPVVTAAEAGRHVMVEVPFDGQPGRVRRHDRGRREGRRQADVRPDTPLHAVQPQGEGADRPEGYIVGTVGSIEYIDRELRLGKGEWESIDYEYKNHEPLEGFEKIATAGSYLTWTTEFSEFLNSITEKRKPSCTGHDGRAALEAVLALRESDEKGQPVRIRSSLA